MATNTLTSAMLPSASAEAQPSPASASAAELLLSTRFVASIDLDCFYALVSYASSQRVIRACGYYNRMTPMAH